MCDYRVLFFSNYFGNHFGQHGMQIVTSAVRVDVALTLSRRRSPFAFPFVSNRGCDSKCRGDSSSCHWRNRQLKFEDLNLLVKHVVVYSQSAIVDRIKHRVALVAGLPAENLERLNNLCSCGTLWLF